MEKPSLAIISHIALGIFLFLCFYFFYLGITLVTQEGDSLIYHIPIAESIARGQILNPPNIISGLGYYPAASESILAAFIKLGIPLNLYNVAGIICLFLLAKKLGIVFGLPKYLSIIFAVSICMLPSVVRLISTQTIDIWIAVFFVWSLTLLEKPKKTLLYFLRLGFALGMLIGSKYSGVLFAVVLFIFYIRKLFPIINIQRLLAFVLPFLIFGLFWYIRNYFLMHNPFYPASFFIFQGHENFHLMNWQQWKTLAYYPNGIGLFMQAFISEFLVWSTSVILVSIYAGRRLIKRKPFMPMLNKLIPLAFIALGIYFILPSWPENIVSDLRYAYSAMIPFVLVSFLLATHYKKVMFIAYIALLNIILVLPQLNYYPKLTFLFFAFFGLYWLKGKNMLDKYL